MYLDYRFKSLCPAWEVLNEGVGTFMTRVHISLVGLNAKEGGREGGEEGREGERKERERERQNM
jgi:hypothetical protein